MEAGVSLSEDAHAIIVTSSVATIETAEQIQIIAKSAVKWKAGKVYIEP